MSIRLGIAGAGSMARNVHVPNFIGIDGVEVVAVCDRLPDRAHKLAADFGIPNVFVLQEDMLNAGGLDGVAVLVEPASLFHVTRRCLEAKIPTMMEKPPGATSFQAASLARIAKENGVFLQVAFNRRYIPLVEKVVAFVRDRTTISQIEGRFMKEGRADFDAGSLSSFPSDTIHCVDLVRSIAGSKPISAATMVSRVNGVVDNAWNSVCRFENGVVATIRANYQTGGRVHTFELHGPGVSAFINLGFGGMECDARVIIGSGAQGYSLAASGAGETEVVEFDGKEIAGSDEFRKYYGYLQEDEDYVTSIREGSLPKCTIDDAAKSFEFVDLILQNRLD